MLIAGKISFLRAFLYIVVQCCGAVAGTAALRALLPQSLVNPGHTSVADSITPAQGLGIEFFLGFILVFCVFGVCDENKPGKTASFLKSFESIFKIIFLRFEIYCAISNWSDRDAGTSWRYPVDWCQHESSQDIWNGCYL